MSKRTKAKRNRKRPRKQRAFLPCFALLLAAAALFFISSNNEDLPFSANIAPQPVMASEEILGMTPVPVVGSDSALISLTQESIVRFDSALISMPELMDMPPATGSLAQSISATAAPLATSLRTFAEPEIETPIQSVEGDSGYAVVMIDNRFILATKTPQDAERAINAVMDTAKTPLLGGKVQRISSAESVDILTQREAPATVYSYEEAFLKLLNGPAGTGYLTLVTQELISTTEDIDYKTETKEDPDMLKGETKTIQQGKDGTRKTEYLVTLQGGEETERELVGEKIVEAPTPKIVVKGTKVVQKTSSSSSSSSSLRTSSSSSTSGKPGPNEGETGPSASPLSFAWPVSGRVSSYFGMRWGRMHYGIDIPGSEGTPLMASEGGTVTSYTGEHGDYGYVVEIDHGNGFRTRYAHNSQNLVVSGQHVSKGEVVALMGDTGNSTTAHIHFEIRANGTPYNPMQYLP